MNRGIVAVLLCLLFWLPTVGLWAEHIDEQNLATLQGYEAFRDGDWVSALFFLRKAVGYGDASQEAWYLLILSEMYGQEYEAAAQDCLQYMELFPEGSFYPLVKYQYGKSLYCSGQYQEAVSQFSEFCHTYPTSEFYPSAIFYIAESFFDEYNYPTAKSLYQRLVEEYPAADRAPEARDRLLLIAQAEREEKLLYLLRVTGEEYLAAKEDYEKQLRKYQSEDSMGLQDQLSKSFSDIQVMRTTVEELQGQNAEQARRIAQLEEENKYLQVSAEEAQRLATELTAADMTVQDTDPSGMGGVNADEAMLMEPIQEEGAMGTVTRYPELESLWAKAAELQRLLEEKSIRGEK
ncbi:MAG: hypothetical protein J6C11_05205 [Spirochaetaceae bacterium]|nr:hypothetical protein [Spirochaetaceae bacterium]